MNVSSTFEKMKTKQYELTGKQRLTVLGTIGMIVLLIVYIITSDAEVAVGPNPSNAASQGTGKISSKVEKQELQAIQVAQSTRDPFALPPEQKELSNEVGRVPSVSAPIPNNTPSMVPKSVVPNGSYGIPKLTGIVGTGGRNLAVISSDNKSKSYSVNEFIGAYKVMAISNDYVVLGNGDSKLVLRLETSGQKGGSNSEK